jgi:hypothetical protein
MRARGWHNGSGCFGVQIDGWDRDRHFDPAWPSVLIECTNARIEARLSPSFWRSCPELRGGELAKWMKANGLARWPGRYPPHFELRPTGHARFRLTLVG